MLKRFASGTQVHFAKGGKQITFKPGALVGGRFQYHCHPSRSIGYYLEVLMYLAPFTRHPLNAVLHGATCETKDSSVDLLKLSMLPILKRFLGTAEGVEITVTRRCVAPEDVGEVLFTCPSGQNVGPIRFLHPGGIKTIRGIVWNIKFSQSFPDRMITAAKDVLKNCVTDIIICPDFRCYTSATSAGFGITLAAETSEGAFLAAEAMTYPKDSGMHPDPEEMGKRVAAAVLHNALTQGCIDSSSQCLTALFMKLGHHEMSTICMGALTSDTLNSIRLLEDSFKGHFITVANEQHADSVDGEVCVGDHHTISLSCSGVGFINPLVA